MWEKKHRIRESQIEVDNGVHPLHWAMSPGPSPMGTDPIKLLKMVLETTSATVNRMLYKVFKTFLWKLQSAFVRQRKPKYDRECRLPQ